MRDADVRSSAASWSLSGWPRSPRAAPVAARRGRPSWAGWASPGTSPASRVPPRHLLGPSSAAVMVFTAAATGIVMLVGIDGRTFVLPPR